MNRTALMIAVVGTLAATAHAADPKDRPAYAEPESSIHFVNMNSVRSWQPDRDRGLWIQDSRRQWYYARTFSPCLGLDHTLSIAFDSRSMSRLDRNSVILLPQDGRRGFDTRCPLESLTKSAPPPSRSRPKKPPPPDSGVEAPAEAGKE